MEQNHGTKYTTKLFGNVTTYDIVDNKENTNTFTKAIEEFSNLEKQYTLSTMGKLKSNYSDLFSGAKTIKQVTGKNINISLETIARYIDYSELKGATFRPVNNAILYENGQVKELSFEFVN